MKTIKLLATLAILAGGAANAVTVSFTGGATSATNQIPPGGSVPSPVADNPYRTITFTNGGGTVTASGFYYNGGSNNVWQEAATRFYTSLVSDPYSGESGLGVTQTNTEGPINGVQQEYILLDFGNGSATVSSLSLWLNSVNGSVAPQYFTYKWLTAGQQPTANSVTPGVPLTAYGTSNPAYSTPSPGAYTSMGIYSFDMSLTGSGRYLLLGSSNHITTLAGKRNTEFLVQSVSFTTVPEGAYTVALLGAGLGALGLASRRRRL